ncbi:unnamed protein product [Rotaria magnacalcarata]|nr:unnamed protein product [Rotaria magnacalcarata]
MERTTRLMHLPKVIVGPYRPSIRRVNKTEVKPINNPNGIPQVSLSSPRTSDQTLIHHEILPRKSLDKIQSRQKIFSSSDSDKIPADQRPIRENRRISPHPQTQDGPNQSNPMNFLFTIEQTPNKDYKQTSERKKRFR